VTGFDTAPPGLTADFSAEQYRDEVAGVIEEILRGEIFQANLTQRFTAPFRKSPLRLLTELRRRTSAPMAAYLRHPGATILSMSPERFLRYEPATRNVETWPIKGTRPRHADPVRDEALARELAESEKDRAENVMIVDLLRNDLSRVCEPGSVQVPLLCTVDSHPTVHHLVSEVTGRLRPDRDALDLIAAAFPGGSITGAPKLRAMEILAEREPVARGVYTGAILWLGFDGALDSSIAIRTVILAGGVATLHAGGGVTARSNPAEEYQECLTKAAALVAALEEAR
jgi:para-aminobenzoate synthetase component 1